MSKIKYLDIAMGMAMIAKDIFPLERNRYTYKREEKKIGRNDSCPCAQN